MVVSFSWSSVIYLSIVIDVVIYLSCGHYLELWPIWVSRYQEVCRYINWFARLQTFKTLLVYQLAMAKISILNMRNVYIYCTHIHKYQPVCPSCQCGVWPKALVYFFGILWPDQPMADGGSSPNLYILLDWWVCWACWSCGSCWSS